MWGTCRESSRNGASLCEGTTHGGPGGRGVGTGHLSAGGLHVGDLEEGL